MNNSEGFLRERNMTQTDLAEAMGYRPSYISMVISGERRVTDSFRWRWLETFGPSALRYLNGNDDDPPK